MGDNLYRYLKVRDQMKSGDCLLWKSNTLLGKAIRIWSKKYNHASFILDEFEEITNHKYILEALSDGIVLRQISDRLENYDGEVYWLKAKDRFDILRKIASFWALQQVGVPYDYGSIFKNMFGKVNPNASKLFCSEFVYMAWRYASLKISNKHIGYKGKVYGFEKAPRPEGIIKMNIWENPVRIF